MGTAGASDKLADTAKAQWDQFEKAASSLTDPEGGGLGDRIMTALGHTAAGLTPIVGPMAAKVGEDLGTGFGTGHPGYALGEATGIAASLAAPEIARAAAPSVAGLADSASGSLRSSAEKNISTAINPTTKINKALVKNQIAPGLVDRGTIATSLKDLQSKAQGHMEDAGQRIDDIFDEHAEAGTTISPKPIIAALHKERLAYKVDGVDIAPAYTAKLSDFQNQIQAVSKANKGDIPLASLRRIRQINDELIAQSKSGFALPPDAQGAVKAAKAYTGAIRQSFAENVPGLADANKEYSFWANVDKTVGDSLQRKTGQRAPLSQKFGELLGGSAAAAVSHNPLTIAGGVKIGGMLGKLANSTIWNTVSAATKGKIAAMLASGDEAGAEALAKREIESDQSKSSSASDNQGKPIYSAVQNASSPKTDGSATTVKVPGQPGPGYPAQYKLKELDEINGSHNGLTFAPNYSYRLVNDRNYANPVNQGKVVNWSSKTEFDPSFHVTDNPDATNGPVVTDSKGSVIGGNGRTMILQRVYNSNPKGAQAYRDLISQKAQQFGLNPDAISSMKQPVLIREIPDSAFGIGGKQDAVTDFNKTGTAGLTPAERAIADSRRVSEGTLADISNRLEEKGSDATVADILRGQGGGEVLKSLISDGVVSPQEKASFLDSSGTLTKAGRDRISQLVIGRFFRDPSQMESVPLSVRAKVERLAGPIAQVENAGSWNLTPHLQEAIDLVDQAKKSGIANVDDFIRQDGLFGKDKYSSEAVQLARLLQAAKSADLVKAARQYAGDASYAAKGNSLMGDDPVPSESFAESFGKLKPSLSARSTQ